MLRDDRQPISDSELEAFEDAIGELGDRVNEFLAEGTDRTPDEVAAAVEDLSKPDPIDDE